MTFLRLALWKHYCLLLAAVCYVANIALCLKPRIVLLSLS